MIWDQSNQLDPFPVGKEIVQPGDWPDAHLRWLSLKTPFLLVNSTLTKPWKNRRDWIGEFWIQIQMRKYILSNQGHCQLFQRDDKKDGEQESVPRGHVFCHLPARVHPHRVSDGSKNKFCIFFRQNTCWRHFCIFPYLFLIIFLSQ